MVKPWLKHQQISDRFHCIPIVFPVFLLEITIFFLRFSWLRCWTLRCTRPTTPTTPTTPRWPRSGRLQRKRRRTRHQGGGGDVAPHMAPNRRFKKNDRNMGVSENSVYRTPLYPLVLLIIIPIKWLFHWEYTLFSDKPTCHNMTHMFEGLRLKNRKPCRHMNRTSRSCHELLQLMSTPVCTSIDFRIKSKRKLFLKNIQFWAVDDVDPSSYEGFRQFRKEKKLNSTRQKL